MFDYLKELKKSEKDYRSLLKGSNDLFNRCLEDKEYKSASKVVNTIKNSLKQLIYTRQEMDRIIDRRNSVNFDFKLNLVAPKDLNIKEGNVIGGKFDFETGIIICIGNIWYQMRHVPKEEQEIYLIKYINHAIMHEILHRTMSNLFESPYGKHQDWIDYLEYKGDFEYE